MIYLLLVRLAVSAGGKITVVVASLRKAFYALRRLKGTATRLNNGNPMREKTPTLTVFRTRKVFL
jgi:hypothetical protein